MAVVRITEELKTRVTGIAEDLFKAAANKAEAARPNIGDFVYDTLFEDHLTALTLVPPEFFGHSEHITIHAINGKSYGYAFGLTIPRPTLQQELALNHGKTHSKYGNSYTLYGDVWIDVQQKIDTWLDGIKRVETEKKDFVNGVKKVLSSYATLAPALKAWPPLWDLLPDYVKDKHKELVKREKKEPSGVDMDLTSLTSVVVKSKLTK